MSIWRYADLLHKVPQEHRISLGEGDTPLIRSRRIGPAAGLRNLFFKLEGGNPAGSFKDRFACAAVSGMLADGKQRCIATSSGNTGAALAAYTAAAGIECHIAIVETAPLSKLKQMLVYGANIFRIKGFGLDPVVSEAAFGELQRMGSRDDSAVQISAYHFSPAGMTGVQTIAHELAEQAEAPVDHVFAPAGGGGLCVALARGFMQKADQGRLDNVPAVEIVQPEGNDTIASPLRRGDEEAQTVTATTKISGLQVPNVIDGHDAVQECRATGGSGHAVPDDLIWETQARLAREEGIFCEPAAATALAGALRAAEEDRIARDANIVCLVTGIGFKDEASIDRMLAGVECPMIDLDQLREIE
ncbi:MAG: pyridoxal-phosphate dependent enzyme [Planctomycetota bacterium]|nr:MAG: pyridoxal-phosphate dependent enzyme [Planctomycetota bacterium]